MKKVTGIGGIFFKCNDSEKLKEWYKTHLGFKTDDYGALFTWKDENGEKAVTQWSTFPATTDYFEPSKKEFMINYRVENLELLLAEFQESGVTVLDKIEEFPYGKFVHILDPEGNKIELWEPKEFEL